MAPEYGKSRGKKSASAGLTSDLKLSTRDSVWATGKATQLGVRESPDI